MKKHIGDFFHRGLLACGFGPIVLSVIYLFLQRYAALETLTIRQVCMGIFSLTALAFIAGGMNAIYQMERLPLMAAIAIHGIVLYVCYLGAYLLNDWLAWGFIPILVFSVIFIVGYLIIWILIYTIIKKKASTLNEQLKQKQQRSTKDPT